MKSEAKTGSDFLLVVARGFGGVARGSLLILLDFTTFGGDFIKRDFGWTTGFASIFLASSF
jgi:hypothetical protein